MVLLVGLKTEPTVALKPAIGCILKWKPSCRGLGERGRLSYLASDFVELVLSETVLVIESR